MLLKRGNDEKRIKASIKTEINSVTETTVVSVRIAGNIVNTIDHNGVIQLKKVRPLLWQKEPQGPVEIGWVLHFRPSPPLFLYRRYYHLSRGDKILRPSHQVANNTCKNN